MDGSSPLARGTRLLGGRAGRAGRFIPARAGNTARLRRPTGRPAVHPRSRGEHYARDYNGTQAAGSSPLARGTRAGAGISYLSRRFTPARAGNTPSPPSAATSTPVHPRSRGEHDADGGAPLAPHRFIPARAGNTGTGRVRSAAGTVHPRSRGEHVVSARGAVTPAGSSPLARGTPRRGGRGGRSDRFIPARAGNTAPRPPRLRRSPVHPRSRGEHFDLGPLPPYGDGSSPLARGTRPRRRRRARPGRFIPARAGNTCSASRFESGRAVHPRSRGEHVEEQFCRTLSTGSSPLARGTPRTERAHHAADRFIPARAGNTRS